MAVNLFEIYKINNNKLKNIENAKKAINADHRSDFMLNILIVGHTHIITENQDSNESLLITAHIQLLINIYTF